MSFEALCPVCSKSIGFPREAIDKKVVCGRCASVHRVRNESGSIVLKVLEESLGDWMAPDEATAAVEPEAEELFEEVAVETRPKSIKLKSWKDKWREESEGAASSSRGTRSGHRATGRRRVR